MFAGSTRLALALALLPAAVAAQAFEYAPGTSTYRVVQTTKAAQEVMGQKQEVESSSNQVMTVTLRRAAKDTIAMNIVLDTISTTNSMGMPTQMVDRFIGMKVAAKVSPVGAFYSVQGPDESSLPAAGTMTEAMGNFLPRLRTAMAKGSTWTDTSSGKLSQNGMDIERTTVSKYTVVGDTTIGAERSWNIVRTDSTALSGSGNTPNGPMSMEGVTKAKGSLFVSPKGVFLGANGTEEATLKIVVAANGMEIGVTQQATTTVEKIK